MKRGLICEGAPPAFKANQQAQSGWNQTL